MTKSFINITSLALFGTLSVLFGYANLPTALFVSTCAISTVIFFMLDNNITHGKVRLYSLSMLCALTFTYLVPPLSASLAAPVSIIMWLITNFVGVILYYVNSNNTAATKETEIILALPAPVDKDTTIEQ